MRADSRLIRLLTVLLVLIVAPAYCMPDNPVELLNKMRKLYPNEKAVYLSFNREVSIDIINDSIKVSSKYFYDMLHLNEQSNIFANDKIFTNHFTKAVDIDAKTLAPDKRRYKVVPVVNFSEKSEISDGIFYDDSKSISFVYPSVSPGARTSLNYKLKNSDPRFLNAFYFGSYLPIINSSLKIQVDKKIKLDFKLLNCDSINLEYQHDAHGKYNTYTWKANDLSSFELERNAPNLSYYAPHIIYFIKEANINEQSVPVLSEVGDLFNMYSEYIADLNEEVAPEIKLFVDSLTQDAPTEPEKVKRIFYWVQDNIKYIAFEQGMRGLIPHDGSLVYKKRYGDCKDMASIIHHMLKAAGIKSYLTWIGSRDIPYRYSQLPTPNVDNHMITTYEHEGKYIFLDATSRFTRYGFPSSMIQGKEALLATGKDTHQVVTVPVMDKEVNFISDSVYVTIKGNALTGTGKLALDGYNKIYTTYSLSGLDRNSEKDAITRLVAKGSNKFFVDSYQVDHINDKDQPLSINYTYRLEDYYRSVGDEIFINLNLDKKFANNFLDLRSRKLPIENEFKYSSGHTMVFEIPKDYIVEYLPTNMEFKSGLFGYSISYNIQDNSIVQVKNIYMDYLLLDKEHFKTWNSFIDSLNNAYRETIILKKEG
jgi:hypothetical protein